MYYYARFVQKETTIIIGDKVQNWSVPQNSTDGLAEIESENVGLLSKYEGELARYQWSCDQPIEKVKKKYAFKCYPPYSSVAHFAGKTKPWQSRFQMYRANTKNTYLQKGAKNFWFKMLNEVNSKFEMGMDLDHWNEKYLPTVREAPLGAMAMYSETKDAIHSATNTTNNSVES